jgi:hypothetical protein
LFSLAILRWFALSNCGMSMKFEFYWISHRRVFISETKWVWINGLFCEK